ncbi:MAG: hypothetical protein AABY18_01235 [Candidatus Thermoplasmatota archaeon]
MTSDLPPLRDHIQTMLDERVARADYHDGAILHWRRLPIDWQDALYRHMRNHMVDWSAFIKRQNPIMFLQKHAKVPLDQIQRDHVRAYLSDPHAPAHRSKRNRTTRQRDLEVGHLVGFLTEVLGAREELQPEATVLSWVSEPALPAFGHDDDDDDDKVPRTVLTEAHRQRALAKLHELPYQGYVRAMYELRMRGLLQLGRRGVNYDELRWPGPGSHGSLPVSGGTAGKMRTDFTPKAYEKQLLQEIRSGSPFVEPGQLVIHDHRLAQTGSMQPPTNQTNQELYQALRHLGDIPDTFAVDVRAVRHRVLTTAWVNGAKTDELRAMANHVASSTVAEDWYLEPLEVAEATKFTDRVLGVSRDVVCGRCMLNLMPYHTQCPRKSCAEPAPQARGLQETSLDAYADAIKLLEEDP